MQEDQLLVGVWHGQCSSEGGAQGVRAPPPLCSGYFTLVLRLSLTLQLAKLITIVYST